MKNNYIKSERMWNVCKRYVLRMFYVISILFTIGIGEMWADDGAVYNCYFTYNDGSDHSQNQDASGMANKDLGTLSSDLKIKAIYLKVWDDWDDNNNNGNHKWQGGQLCYTKDNFSSTSYCTPSSWTYGSRSKNSDQKYRNYELQKSSTDYTIVSLTEASGSYTLKYYWQVWHNTNNSYLNNGGSNYQFTYKIRPPEVDGGDFTIVPANYISGTGADSDHPMLIANGQTSTTFTVTASKAHADANSLLWVSFNNGSNWSQGANATATTVTSGSMTVDGTVRSFTVKVKFRNDGASLESATVLSKTIYYKEQPAGITVTAGSNGTVSTDNSNWSTSETIEGISLNTWYNIYAKGNTHYDFDSWTKGTNSSNITLEGSSASTRIKIASGAVSSVTANFVEHPYTITIVGGTSANTTAKVVTTGTATSQAPVGKYFTSWTVPASNFTLVGCTTSSDPITFNATANGTVTANFGQKYAYIQGRFHITNASRNGSWTNTFGNNDADSWEENSTSIPFSYDETNHQFYLRTYATPKELSTQISSSNPYFFIKTSRSSGSLTNVLTYRPYSSGSDNQELTTAGDSYKKTIGTYDNSHSFWFNSTDESGYVKLYFNETKIWYWLEQTLEYNGNGNSGGSAPASKTYYDKGTSVQAATNSYTKSGYTFTGWNTKANGSGSAVAASGWYTLNANTTFYAQWSENNYTVIVQAGEHGSVASGSVTGHKDTKVTLPTATADPGYYFTGWTRVSGSTVTWTNQSSATAAQVNGLTSGVTVQANFAPLWTLKGGKTGQSDWSLDAHIFTSYVVNDQSHNEGQQSFTLDPNTTYRIKLRNRQTSSDYGLASGAATTNVYYATSNNWWVMTNASGNQNLIVNTAAGGTYNFYWDINDNELFILYPTSWYITTGQSDAAGGSFTAVDNSSNNVKGGKFVANDATVTFTANKNTGYTFDGWFYNADYDNSHKYVDNNTDINLSGDDNKVLELSSIGADKAAYAKFTAKNYTVTLTRSGTGYGSGGTASITATYNQTLPAATMPTAANGYAFMGYYTSAGGEGSQIINASGVVQTVAGYTDGDKKWIRDADTELFAYFKKAEITNLAVTPGTVETGGTVTATPTISPTPTGDHIVCWRLLQNNDNPVGSQPTFTPGAGNAVSFTAPTVSGSYKVECVLRTGTTCGAGTTLDSVVTSFVVAGVHTVTIRYQDSDGRTLAASTSMSGRPLDWSSSFGPADVVGYTFDHWVAGDGVTISTNGTSAISGSTTTTPTIYIKASYDGNLTAVYTKKNMIYFNNTLGWDHVYVYFYSSDKYWDATYGSGAQYDKSISSATPHEYHFWGEMTQITGTNIYYFDYEAAAATINPGNASKINDYKDVVFTKDPQGYPYGTSGKGYEWFHNTQAARRGDFKHSLSMYVPETTKSDTRNGVDYFSNGYWMNYPENTGYKLKVYDGSSSGASEMEYKSVYFPFTEDHTLPASVSMDLEGNKTYGFTVARADGNNYRYDGTFNATGSQNLATGVTNHTGVRTNAAGTYTFTLSHSVATYSLGVKFPVAVNDWRIIYRDLATWSQKDAHTASWCHPSAPIARNTSGTETKRDIISFYWAYGSTPTLQTQKCTAVGTGTVTWGTPSSAIDVSSFSSVLTENGVYNFIFEQPAGGASIALVGVEPYTGNYYIRTDCAGGGKWDNFRGSDHLMTYSEFSKSRETNKFGELYTHYFMHWCPRLMNVKFVIANDYSMCITDTLIKDIDDPYSNINEDGFLKTDNAGDATGDRYSANIRFMYNESTNKISRAYLSSSTNKSKQFLVLKGNATFWNSDGTALSGSGESADNKEAIFEDNEDWIYERMIKLTPGSLFKLYACYAKDPIDVTTAQYFRGTYNSGTFTKDVSAIELIGGTGSNCNARIIYDFKTNRLIAAYLPDGSDIDGTQAIKADLMMVREHQEAGQQLTFKDGSAKLTDVYTVYGVMRFNRWILNNRANPTDHAKDHSDTDAHISTFHPLLDAGSQKSIAERGLYWISFPFDVNLSEVFGFGTYGTHWIMMRYNGAERARIGYWKDNEEGFWEYIWDRKGVTLEAGQGYVLALELDLMAANNRSFWANGIQQVELFFPSTASAGTIKQTNVDVTIPSHECTIDRRTDKTTPDWNNDRRIADSHWNIIGVPSYANYGSTLSNGSSNITWQVNPKADGLPFLYEWNANDNTYTVQSGTKYNFKAMHAYYVQYAGTLRWTLASATPSIVARRTYAEESENVEFKLELTQNDKMIDQTFVKLSNDEEASTNFAFGEDLDKEFNDGKANVYTFIEGYIPSAGNTMPMTDQTTLVPVGVKITKAGEYTFAIPDGTSGVGVTLIDNVANTRTNLSALDYTVNLMAGTIDNRFVLEISPIHNATTGIEQVVGKQDTDVRKVLIDGILYIVKDGKMYDVRGTMIK